MLPTVLRRTAPLASLALLAAFPVMSLAQAGSATRPEPALPQPAPPAAAPETLLHASPGAELPASGLLPHDLSPWGMFSDADIVVQTVMAGLALASVVTWAVLLVKMAEIWSANRNLRRSAGLIARATGLDEAVAASAGRHDPASEMLRAAAAEMDRSAPVLAGAGTAGLKERVTSELSAIAAIAGRRAAAGTGVLATIGSTAPFVGLFGTVWGIMNAFIGISEARTTNLAVVAPGIAEALLATALGLVAAIPAVVIYNLFARQIAGYRLRLSGAAAGIERLLSRDLDFRAGTGA